MARKRGNQKRLLKGAVDKELTLAALAANDVIAGLFTDTVTEQAFALSTELTWSKRDGTVGEGPIIVGLAHSDYTAAEIEEYLENTGSWEIGDMVQQEIARRKIRIVGTFPQEAVDEVLNDGKPIKTTLKFVLSSGQTVQVFAFNKSGGALTTGTIINCEGHCWLRPQ